MPYELEKKPKNARMIEGFPGFGLVGTITTEYLLNHLSCEYIGQIWFNELPATTIIHNNKLIHPIGLYYNKKYNIVLLHAISGIFGTEWKISEEINAVAKELDIKEIICIEGVGSNSPDEKNQKVFFYTTEDRFKPTLKKIVPELNEGIIVGVTAAVLLKAKAPVTAFFADTHTNLPDSKAAAKIIETLDKYLDLDIEIKPLLETATKFETKLKALLQQSKDAQQEAELKKMSYVG